MPGGRPTDYDPSYCQIAIDYMKDGKHAIQLAAHLGVSKATLYNWANEHAEFLDALNSARTASTAAWLDQYQKKAFGLVKDGSDYLLAKMIGHKDKEFQEAKEDKKEDSPAAALLNQISTEALSVIARELTTKKTDAT